MADRIVVLNAGNIEQYGSPLEFYDSQQIFSSPASSAHRA
jgi:ABC-type Fe3+/spermidine/putrescine transport system ATPase subunit